MAHWITIEDFYFYKCSVCDYIEGKKRKYCAGCGSRMEDYDSDGKNSTIKCDDNSWILVSDRLPDDNVPVNITWINRNPAPYYAEIKDKPFTATAVYFYGKWYWFSATVMDMLAEYGKSEFDEINNDIEIVAWMPLPKPYGERKESE